MPEKCALSHGSGVLGRDPRDSCRFWSPHVEKVCTVTQIRLGQGGGGGIPLGGGGGVGEPRTGIIYICRFLYTYTYTCTHIKACICTVSYVQKHPTQNCSGGGPGCSSQLALLAENGRLAFRPGQGGLVQGLLRVLEGFLGFRVLRFRV